MSAEPRTLAPFGRRRARVVANERYGAYAVFSAQDPDGPADPRPGQFYMLAAASRWGAGTDERPYLPRAFSFARAREGALSFLVEAVGPGTERLAELEPGADLWLTGPVGTGFAAPERGTSLLVGGGIGAAPLVCWQDDLLAGSGGPEPEVLLGFRSAEHAEARRLFAGEPRVATDDGSIGPPRLVTELLRESLDENADVAVYACGPPPMLEAVRAMCAERGVPAQLALESGMACGYGACFGCVVPTKAGYLRLCVDGPVLEADVLETALVRGAGH
jgi:dihydroorotate dehydrogenase electron transfer subunit